jgi:hypothetical protein
VRRYFLEDFVLDGITTLFLSARITAITSH